MPNTWYVAAAALFVSVAAYPCTIFTAAVEGKVLAANSEDYYLDATPLMWVTVGEGGDYGRVTFGFERKEPFAQGGINEKGLFFDAAVTPEGSGAIKGKPKAPENMGERMLAECATVGEAVAWLGQYNLHLLKHSHLLLADAFGAAVVVELMDGEMQVFAKEGKGMAVTNSLVSKPELGNHPCPRLGRVGQMMSGENVVTVDHFRDVLNAVAVPKTFDATANRDGGTLYSNVYDLAQGVVHTWLRADFEKGMVVDVAEWLGKGSRTYYLDDLFD